jgi:hypothetical protein
MRGAVTLIQLLLGPGNTFEDLKFINALASKSIGTIVLETCLLLGRWTVTELILCNTVYRVWNILFYFAQYTVSIKLHFIDKIYCATLQFYP